MIMIFALAWQFLNDSLLTSLNMKHTKQVRWPLAFRHKIRLAAAGAWTNDATNTCVVHLQKIEWSLQETPSNQLHIISAGRTRISSPLAESCFYTKLITRAILPILPAMA